MRSCVSLWGKSSFDFVWTAFFSIKTCSKQADIEEVFGVNFSFFCNRRPVFHPKQYFSSRSWSGAGWCIDDFSILACLLFGRLENIIGSPSLPMSGALNIESMKDEPYQKLKVTSFSWALYNSFNIFFCRSTKSASKVLSAYSSLSARLLQIKQKAASRDSAFVATWFLFLSILVWMCVTFSYHPIGIFLHVLPGKFFSPQWLPGSDIVISEVFQLTGARGRLVGLFESTVSHVAISRVKSHRQQ